MPSEKKKVCKLKKSLYVLKQAAKAWNQKIAEILQLNKFQQSIADNSLFTKEEKVSRPDVALAVNTLRRKNEIPMEKDWTLLKKLLMYLNASKHFNFVFNSLNPLVFTCYTDANWASDNLPEVQQVQKSFLSGTTPFLVSKNTELYLSVFL
ncbi:hypothetical protein NPIL_330991 [Nephila pilipes]|uniref:Reverse transcriptase Ty1/copia-type domain-containing protein n=1 Tax=Nephila pilipes TaxID=299642 RepID=A0A8X6Q567_NEPPI|nr:hypothetical protein NPIL_330991 [Nephila pilipes]